MKDLVALKRDRVLATQSDLRKDHDRRATTNVSKFEFGQFLQSFDLRAGFESRRRVRLEGDFNLGRRAVHFHLRSVCSGVVEFENSPRCVAVESMLI
jgi:hypothetical protein